MNEKLNKIFQYLKNPKGWFLALIYVCTVIFSVAAITIAIINPQNLLFEILSYITYAFAAVFLGYSVYSIVIYAKSIKKKFTEFIKRFKFGERMLDEYSFRTVIFASISALINIFYVGFHVFLAFVSGSFFWYGSLAVYYGLLFLLRGGIVMYHKKNGVKAKNSVEREFLEIKKYRTCGVVLTLIPLCLLVPVLQIIFLDKAFIHEGLSIFAFAAYAFYKIIMAIYNIFRSNKEKTAYAIQAVRGVGLADAFVSIFSLQTALLYAFSNGTEYNVFNLITGFAVIALTIALGVIMIVRANNKIKSLQQTKG